MSLTAPVSPESACHDTLQAALHACQLQSTQRCLLVIDAAQYPEQVIMKTLYATSDNPQWQWLFEDSPLASVADAGPIVVETVADSPLCQYTNAHWADSGLLFLFTEETIHHAVAGLRAMLSLHLETAGPCIMRPYDPRFLELLSACQPDQMAALADADSHWIWSVDGVNRVQWRSYQTTEAPGRPRSHQARDFERLLGWVRGWPLCASLSATGERADIATVTRFITAQWRAGIDFDDNRSALESQWYAFRTNRPMTAPAATSPLTARR